MKLKGIHIKGVTEKGGKVKPVKKFKSVSQRIAPCGFCPSVSFGLPLALEITQDLKFETSRNSSLRDGLR